MKKLYSKLKGLITGVVSKIRLWFRREPSIETLKQELYSPEAMALYCQTLNTQADFSVVLGSIADRFEQLGMPVNIEVMPRA